MTDFAQLLARMPPAVADQGGTPAERPGLAGRKPGAGLALSGGGFRAMLFHAGALRRLHETGALRHVARVSSVSGGSITAAQLAIRWEAIHRPGAGIDDFERLVQNPLVELAGSKIDATRGLLGVLKPRASIADEVARAFDGFLGQARLREVPDEPRFVFCATNLGSGSLLRFAKPYTADYRIGRRDHLDLPLGTVVAASAAFPPFLSPLVVKLDDAQALTGAFDREPGEPAPPLAGVRPYTHRLELTDGGVYDNLGLQPVDQFHTLLVSDGGGPFEHDESVPANWLGHMIRAWKVTDNQVRSLRRHSLISQYRAGERLGAFWGIRTPYADYPARAIEVHPGWPAALQAIPTRLWTIAEADRHRLVNWGYCITDAAIRSYVDGGVTPDPALPYPGEPLDRAVPERSERWWRGLLPG